MKNVKGVTPMMGSAVHAAKRCADMIAILIEDQTEAETLAKIESTLRRYGEESPNISLKEIMELRTVAKELHVTFSSIDLGDTVQQLNVLLNKYAQVPRLTNHQHTSWHLHVDSNDHASWPEWFAASSAFALAILIAEKQRPPGGICLALGCNNPYIDLGKGGGRTFCSSRCATRHRVTQYRKRQTK